MSNPKFNSISWTLSASENIPKFGTSTEASIWTQISKQRLEELAHAGIAPCVRIDGGEPLFYKRDIVLWVKENLIKIQDGKDLPIRYHLHLSEGVDVETVPKEIANLPGLSEWKCAIPKACIYFLAFEGKVVYVGQSVSLPFRIVQHKSDDKTFDQIFYLPVPMEQLNQIERKFISTLRPTLNKVFPSVEEALKLA